MVGGLGIATGQCLYGRPVVGKQDYAAKTMLGCHVVLDACCGARFIVMAAKLPCSIVLGHGVNTRRGVVGGGAVGGQPLASCWGNAQRSFMWSLESCGRRSWSECGAGV